MPCKCSTCSFKVVMPPATILVRFVFASNVICDEGETAVITTSALPRFSVGSSAMSTSGDAGGGPIGVRVINPSISCIVTTATSLSLLVSPKKSMGTVHCEEAVLSCRPITNGAPTARSIFVIVVTPSVADKKTICPGCSSGRIMLTSTDRLGRESFAGPSLKSKSRTIVCNPATAVGSETFTKHAISTWRDGSMHSR